MPEGKKPAEDLYSAKTHLHQPVPEVSMETREREELFVKQIVDAVENSLKQALPLFLSGLTAGMVQREPQISNVINLRKFQKNC